MTKTTKALIAILVITLIGTGCGLGVVFDKWMLAEEELKKWTFEEGATSIIDNTSVVTVRDDWMVFEDITFVVSGGKSQKKFADIKDDLGKVVFSQYGKLSKVVYTTTSIADGITYYVIHHGGKVCCICQPQTSTTNTTNTTGTAGETTAVSVG